MTNDSTNLYRILDANLNRSREALRVVEEYVRFRLDCSTLTETLKQMRHDLRSAADSLPQRDLLASRDTVGDVGRQLSTPAELDRGGTDDVLRAALKRLPESLRALEEYAKPLSGQAAARFEQLRYRAYTLEKSLNTVLNPDLRLKGLRLYVLVTGSLCRRPPLETIDAVLAGGADAIQLREKEMPGGELLDLARALVQRCRKAGALSIINDRADVARASGADGVHVGQGDLGVRACRQVLGPGAIVGLSAQTTEMAVQALEDGADYLGVGPVFAGTTKTRDFVIGIDGLTEVCRATPLPTVAIAGITLENLGQVLAAVPAAVAVCSDIISCDDPQQRTAAIKQKILEARPVE
ncbi:MAG: thiamine phosphate synthase [Anaerolineaceae bacterium]|nr:thiamine phosphate synthase [Anaerolineaceae bacterium]